MYRLWLRRRWFVVGLGLVTGAAVGLAVYHGSHLTGAALFAVCGATAGAVAAIVAHGYGRTIRLTDVKITVPQFSEFQFTVTRESQQVAWKLFVECSTRTSSQALHSDTGLLREALSSLYGLFATVRETLKQTQPSKRTGSDPTVEHLAISMLNIELRPFLSHWHPQLLRWERQHPDSSEADWPDNELCRSELAAMQQRLRAYVLAFGRLAQIPNTEQIVDGTFGPELTPVAIPAQAPAGEVSRTDA